MNILDPSYGGRSWLRVVRDSLALVGVSVTCKELGQRTCGEVLAAQDWAAQQQRTTESLPMPTWLLDREEP